MMEILQKRIQEKITGSKLFTYFFFPAFFMLPFVAFAQATVNGTPQNLGGYVTLFLSLYGLAVPILTGLAFLLFFWGVAKFILSAGNQKELATGRSYMIWGIIALFILVTIWGIIQFMSNELSFNNNATITSTPLLPTQ